MLLFFSKYSQRHSMARLLGRGMEWLLWVHCNVCSQELITPGRHKSLSNIMGSRYISEPDIKTNINNSIQSTYLSLTKTPHSMNTSICVVNWCTISFEMKFLATKVSPVRRILITYALSVLRNNRKYFFMFISIYDQNQSNTVEI